MPYKVAAAAAGIDKLDQSAWQRGCIDGSAWINRRANLFGLACFFVGGAVGAAFLTSPSLLVRLLEGGLAGIAAWVLVNLLVYGGHTAAAYRRQREESRDRVREVERAFAGFQEEVELRFTLMTIANTIKDGIDGATARVNAGDDLEADRTFFRNITPHVARDLEKAGLRHLADDFRTKDYPLDAPNDVLNSMRQFSNKLLALVSNARQFPEASRLLDEREAESGTS
jgi:hypothetical protein